MTEIIADGGCLCGAVRYTIKGELIWAGYCHCEDCRRHVSSPVASFIDVYEKDLMFHGDGLSVFKSSENVERSFCSVCGSPISYATSERPEELQLYTATLDAPEKILPQSHVHWNERLPWFNIHDDLTKYQRGEIDG